VETERDDWRSGGAAGSFHARSWLKLDTAVEN
jgi:hypothetical protein